MNNNSSVWLKEEFHTKVDFVHAALAQLSQSKCALACLFFKLIFV